MGSIGLMREKGLSNADFFAAELGVEVVADTTIGGVWYGAIKAPNVEGVFAYVSPISWSRDGYFVYKMQDETMGPYAAQASAKVLDALDPIDSDYANEWRAKCRANLAAKAEAKIKAKAVKAGTVLQFAKTLEFGDGASEDTFTFVERSTFLRKSDYRRVRIPNWKTYDYEVA